MAVGAFAAYNLAIRLPLPQPRRRAPAGGSASPRRSASCSAFPSLRIKGFYLAVATLAAQFFLDWVFLRIPWFTNYSPSGSVTSRRRRALRLRDRHAGGRNTSCRLAFVVRARAACAKNLVRGRIGRAWMAIRDMDVAAEIIGIRPLYAKLSAFAVSSFYCRHRRRALGASSTSARGSRAAFDIDRSFQLLFMIIIGGLGSILGCFLGAAFIVAAADLAQPGARLALGSSLISTATVSHLEFMIFGALIVFFLIVEPHGLARLWAIGKEKLRLWPFPH